MSIRERRLPDEAALEADLAEANYRHILARISIPAIAGTIEKAFLAEVDANLARVACAITRFHQDHGSYPDSLESLVPDYIKEIPSDPYSPGSTLKYRPDYPGDRYRIYSVGENGVDDGGAIVFRNRSTRRDSKQGDRAWAYSL